MKSLLLLFAPSLALAATTATSKIPKTAQGNLIILSYNIDGIFQMPPNMAAKAPLPANLKGLPQYKNTNLQLLTIQNDPGMGGSPSSVAGLNNNLLSYNQTGFVDPKGNCLQIAPTGNLIMVGSSVGVPKERTNFRFNDDGTITGIYKVGCIGSIVNEENVHYGNLEFVPGTVAILVKQNKCVKFNFRNPKTGNLLGNTNYNGKSGGWESD